MRVRLVHTWLGVFFSPLLLLFVITGCWQTFVDSDDADKGAFNQFMAQFSNIHTDDYFSHAGGHHHASRHFRIFVACMAASLILTILLGLSLACINRRRLGWMALSFALGVAVPVLILYFN